MTREQLMKHFESCLIPLSKEEAAQSHLHPEAQLFNGQWCVFMWGCDTFQNLFDSIADSESFTNEEK